MTCCNSKTNEACTPQRLFNDFPSTSYEEWKEAAMASLKGASFDRTLTKTYEGIDLQPLYMAQDVEGLPHMGSLPGFYPFVRGADAGGSVVRPWGICQEIALSTPEASNRAARHDLENGQTALGLVLDHPTRLGLDPADAAGFEVGYRGISISHLDDLRQAMTGLDIQAVPVFLLAGVSAVPVLGLFVAWLHDQGKIDETFQGCLGADPLGEMARQGRLPIDLETAYDFMAAAARWAGQNTPRLRTILVQGCPYHEGGGSATQELAFALATGVDYMRALLNRGLDVDAAAGQMHFSFSIGGHFFMEIAKLRAARMLWARIVEAFGGGSDAQKMKIHGRTSAWTKTIHDPYVNMIRNTVEALAGAVGGVDSLFVRPFDDAVRPADEFSRRVSRNVQIILQQESRVTHPIDPGGGSWFLEVLTDQAAQKAWEIFQEIESRGGMFKALSEGLPQTAVESVAQKRFKNLSTRRDVLVGTNLYPNLLESPLAADATDYTEIKKTRIERVADYKKKNQGWEVILSDIERTDKTSADLVSKAAEAFAAGATLGDVTGALTPRDPVRITPVRIHRGAEPFEKLRQRAREILAATGHLPQVFLANMGPIPQHKARADFSSGFFEVGGFEVLTNTGFSTVEAAARAALDSGVPIVVICSTDKTYPDIVPPLTRQIKADKPHVTVILAGKPSAEHEASYREAGLDDFIHLRSDSYQVLLNLQHKCRLPERGNGS